MPNWCSSNVRITFKERKDAERFERLFGEWTKDAMKNGFGEGWLGNIALNSGVGFWKDVDCVDAEGNRLFVRGSAWINGTDDRSVDVGEDSAWSPAFRVWKLVLDKHFAGAVEDMTYWAEEPGCGLYATNDPDLAGRYEIDVFDDPPEHFPDAESTHEAGVDEFADFVRKACETDETDLDKLKELADGADWFSANEWTEEPFDNWD